MKRTVILFLALMTVGAHAQQGAPTDVPRTHWAFDAVDTLFRQGLLKGYPDGTFKGNRPASRYEMAGALDNLNRHFQSRLAGMRVAYNPQTSEFADLQTRIGALRLEVAAIQASQREVAEMTAQMTSLRDQLAKLRGNLGEMRQDLPQK
ncbi:S-layer homology domain-containing protein [bacterium]|nr:MAG: S-layer homology domain-containing protein [bacterium]